MATDRKRCEPQLNGRVVVWQWSRVATDRWRPSASYVRLSSNRLMNWMKWKVKSFLSEVLWSLCPISDDPIPRSDLSFMSLHSISMFLIRDHNWLKASLHFAWDVLHVERLSSHRTTHRCGHRSDHSSDHTLHSRPVLPPERQPQCARPRYQYQIPLSQVYIAEDHHWRREEVRHSGQRKSEEKTRSLGTTAFRQWYVCPLYSWVTSKRCNAFNGILLEFWQLFNSKLSSKQ